MLRFVLQTRLESMWARSDARYENMIPIFKPDLRRSRLCTDHVLGSGGIWDEGPTLPALGYSRRVETSVLPPETTPLQATIIIDNEELAKLTAEGSHPAGLSIFTDGSRTDTGAVGYAVTWHGRATRFTWA